MRQNLVYALRAMRRSPGFTIAAVASLALGIGATTAIFSLTDQVVLRSLPVENPGELVVLHREYTPTGSTSSDNGESTFAYPLYRDLRERVPALAGMVARSGAGIALAYEGSTERVRAEVISGNYFDVLGVQAAAGRLFTAEDDVTPGGHPVAVLSHAYWTTRFGGDAGVVGRTVTVNGLPMTVIGVAAEGFRSLQPGTSPQVFVTIAMQKTVMPTEDLLDDPMYKWLNVFARLGPGVTRERAQAATNVAYGQILAEELERNPRMKGSDTREKLLGHTVELRSAPQGINVLRNNYERPLLAMLTMAALVLLIACANVAGLLLARAAGRQKEIAVRLALGATRWALLKQLLVEGLALAVPAGALGLAAAWAGSRGLLAALPAGFAGRWLQAEIDARMLGFTLVIAVLCGVMFALAPALQSTKPRVVETLKLQAASVAQGGSGLRRAMVAGQVALSLILLVGAGLFATTLYRLLAVDLGFRTERLLFVSLDATVSRRDVASANAFYRDVEERLRATAGVTDVAVADTGPFSGSERSGSVTVEGVEPSADAKTTDSTVNAGYFEAMEIPLVAGRGFDARDTAGALKVAVVNQAFVARYFPDGSALGKRIQFSYSVPPEYTHTIIGVVADSRKSVRDAADPRVFLTYTQWERPERLAFYIRTAGDPVGMASTVRELVRQVDARVPVGDPAPVTVLVRNSLSTERVLAILAAAFGLAATLLAAIGLYGVVAFAVARRTREIGVRMALGAVPGDVLALVLRDAGVMVGVGVTVGAAGAAGLGRLVEAQLFGVEAGDPRMILGAAVVLVVAALAAAWGPAWRASRMDPVGALKYE